MMDSARPAWRNFRNALLTSLTVALIFWLPLRINAQDKDYEARRQRAFALIDQSKFAEAQQLFDALAKENPQDAPVQFGLGFTTFALAKQIKDPEERRKARLRARESLVRAKELGIESELLEGVIASIPPDGSDDTTFSKNPEADKAMHEGEAAFTSGNLDAAIKAYMRAFQLDPRLYEAPLFVGDMYRRKKEVEKAGEWFTKAIEIDPNRETAYRYWGQILMTTGRMEEARDKFIDAIIAAPYSQLTWESGLMTWADKAGVQLGHPRIEIPTGVSSTSSGDVNITLDPALLSGKEDGSSAWLMYGITRANWRKDKFAKTFPQEKAYRHSLAEEAEALRLVAATAKADKKAKKLTQSLSNLVMLADAGLIEAYILLAQPDKGIVRDYDEYRKSNRQKLKQYLLDYVVGLKRNEGKF